MTPAAPPFELFRVRDFALECGAMLPEVALAYHVRGALDGRAPVLTCSAFAQNYDDLAYLRAPGALLDRLDRPLIHTELLGNGRSSSPGNSAAPRGPAFPHVTIRDNVRLQALLLDWLGVDTLYLVLGASMGGQQAIQWAVSQPQRVQQAAVIVGSAQATWHAQLFLRSLATALRSDPAFADGHYSAPPLTGLARMSELWAPWAFSPAFYAAGATQLYADTAGATLDDFLAQWRTRYYQRDANDLLCHLATWAAHDVAQTPGCRGDLATALGRVQARVLFVPASSDAYFAPADVQREAALVPHARVATIDTINGHTAGFGRGADDRRQIDAALADFLAFEAAA